MEEKEKRRAELAAREAARLSKINKDSLPINIYALVPGRKYYTSSDDSYFNFIFANTINGKKYGVKQVWEGPFYGEAINVYMEWFEISEPVFANWADARDYKKLSSQLSS